MFFLEYIVNLNGSNSQDWLLQLLIQIQIAIVNILFICPLAVHLTVYISVHGFAGGQTNDGNGWRWDAV
jgi:hypothetical protein